MRISARNQIKGTVVEVTKGATTSHVRVDIGNGQIVNDFGLGRGRTERLRQIQMADRA